MSRGSRAVLAEESSPSSSFESVMARHRARLGWSSVPPHEASAAARAWSASLPGVSPELLQLSLSLLDEWPQLETLKVLTSRLSRDGVLVRRGRAATPADVSAWPETLDRLTWVSDNLSPSERFRAYQQRSLAINVWLSLLHPRLEDGAIMLDATELPSSLSRVLPALLTGGCGPLALPWTLADIQRAAGCALALRIAAPAVRRASA